MLEAHKVDREMAEAISKVEQEMAASLLGPLFQKVEESAPSLQALLAWLQEVKSDLVSRLNDFREKEGEPSPKAAEISRYQVNAFVDRTRQVGAPLVQEMNPSYYNLIGKIEFRPIRR
jgi:hypothetical protein